jgi:hypothetical protein
MIPVDAKAARAIGFLLIYAFFFWRLIRSNRGDKFIQCGGITVMLFLVLMALSRIPHFPLDDYAPWFAIPAFSPLCSHDVLPISAAIPRAQIKDPKKPDGIAPPIESALVEDFGLLDVRLALPVQTVDATPSIALIRQCLPGRSGLFGCPRSKPSQGSVPADLTLTNDLTFVFNVSRVRLECCVDLLKPPR